MLIWCGLCPIRMLYQYNGRGDFDVKKFAIYILEKNPKGKNYSKCFDTSNTTTLQKIVKQEQEWEVLKAYILSEQYLI